VTGALAGFEALVAAERGRARRVMIDDRRMDQIVR